MHQFEKLKIWQKAMDITETVYRACTTLPQEEKFNLTSQMKRCSVSIPSNIAEGSGRNSKNEFAHFLGIANGSTFELITQLMISKRLGLIDELKITPIINELVEVSNMNFALQKTLKNQ
ncbi:four helix bundle protein [Flavobacterium hiemivividum]|uniref:Four helix bundle protein n=1 Tax=Flavobacterium hiemivividum TaxID=2541734 RepID=A0A4R5CZ02_9FLAO|nr:four helix bundle protein [Flavobacterium hiemivividum]TDE03834.1 four helix bundle protein [Flavobacterium hiemivividum]